MTEFLQVFLLAFAVSSLYDLISPKAKILKKRIKLRRAAKMYMQLSEAVDNDYDSGFFYGKAKLFEQKLKETRYFDYE